MLLTYFDEVKPSPPDQPFFWLGGLMVDDYIAPQLENELHNLAVVCFGEHPGLTKQTEFHATDIAAGSKHFKRLRDPSRRFDILKRLIRIYDKPEGVYRVAVRLDVNRLYENVVVEELALTLFVERVNQFAKSRKTIAMLIGDFEKEKASNKAIQNLAGYREDGTPYAFGQEIQSIVDTIHFAHSHHSRLLQLADTYLWTRQLMHRMGKQSDLRSELIKFINDETDTGWEHKYKHFPSENVL